MYHLYIWIHLHMISHQPCSNSEIQNLTSPPSNSDVKQSKFEKSIPSNKGDRARTRQHVVRLCFVELWILVLIIANPIFLPREADCLPIPSCTPHVMVSPSKFI